MQSMAGLLSIQCSAWLGSYIIMQDTVQCVGGILCLHSAGYSAVYGWLPLSSQCRKQCGAWVGSSVFTVQDIEHRSEITFKDCLLPNDSLFPFRPQLLKVPQLPQIVPLVRDWIFKHTSPEGWFASKPWLFAYLLLGD